MYVCVHVAELHGSAAKLGSAAVLSYSKWLRPCACESLPFLFCRTKKTWFCLGFGNVGTHSEHSRNTVGTQLEHSSEQIQRTQGQSTVPRQLEITQSVELLLIRSCCQRQLQPETCLASFFSLSRPLRAEQLLAGACERWRQRWQRGHC